jgi:phosphatidylglycerol---prolipoprotein diacylglyceryl transferase
MYPFLSIGPLSLPTAPFFVLLAGWAGLSIMARAGAKQALHPDRVMTAGLIALFAALIVARLWHVIQFWGIYQAEPLMIFSLRPGGMNLSAGIIGAVVAGYAYLLYARLDPLKVTAALGLGLLVAEAFLQIGAFLTGQVVGQPSALPWATLYFGERLHPVGLYRAVGAVLTAAMIFVWGDFSKAARITLTAILGYALARLIADGFVADAALLGPFRVSQIVAFVAALAASLLLSRMQWERFDNID